MHPKRVAHRRVEWLTALSVAAYFFYWNWDRARMTFASDEMMNIAIYFRPGPWHAIGAQFCVWSNNARPMGALFYLPLYYLFGLDPAPYQIVASLILAANGYWIYRFARILGCGKLTAAAATVVGVYHPGLTNLHYNTDMIFDVLCFFFYFAAFAYYARIRAGGRTPGLLESAGFLLLYLGALDAKEMAVTLPLVLVFYEFYFLRDAKFRGCGRLILSAGALNILYMAGRVLGPDPMMHASAYTPVFSWARVVDFQVGSLSDILCYTGGLKWPAVAAVWAAVTAIAWLGRNPALRFCWFFMIVTPLPIEFLSQRYQGCLYIPMAAWVAFIAIVAAGVLRRGARPFRGMPRREAVAAVFAAAALIVWCREVRYRKINFINPAAGRQGQVTREVIRQFEALHPRVPRGAKVVFLNDPFDGFDTAFIAELILRDRDLEVHLQRHNPLPEALLPTAHAIFDFRDGQLVQLK